MDEYLRTLSPIVTDLYPLYDEGKLPNVTYTEMANAVIAAAQEHPPVAFSTYGHVGVYCKPSQIICEQAPKLGLGVKMLPGVSAFDTLFADCGFDPCQDGLIAFEATDVLRRQRQLYADVATLIWQPGVVGSAVFTRQ